MANTRMIYIPMSQEAEPKLPRGSKGEILQRDRWGSALTLAGRCGGHVPKGRHNDSKLWGNLTPGTPFSVPSKASLTPCGANRKRLLSWKEPPTTRRLGTEGTNGR